jgi:PAS domain-containing protein
LTYYYFRKPEFTVKIRKFIVIIVVVLSVLVISSDSAESGSFINAKKYDEISFIKEFDASGKSFNFKVKFKVVSKNNNFNGIIIILDDITNQKKVSEDLERNEKFLREITDNMLDYIIKADNCGVIQYVSPSCKNFLGYNYRDFLGHSIFSGIHRDDLDKVQNIWNKCLISKSGDIFEYRYSLLLCEITLPSSSITSI